MSLDNILDNLQKECNKLLEEAIYIRISSFFFYT